jgi:hypothetical protein
MLYIMFKLFLYEIYLILMVTAIVIMIFNFNYLKFIQF